MKGCLDCDPVVDQAMAGFPNAVNMLKQEISEVEARFLHVPYCCQHVLVLIRRQADNCDYELHGLVHGQHLIMFADGKDCFKGHPACSECQRARHRFIVGLEGNVIQRWSEATFSYNELFAALECSNGRFVARSTTAHAQCYRESWVITPTFVRRCERELWQTKVVSRIDGRRPVMEGRAPYASIISKANEIIKTNAGLIQPFAATMRGGIFVRVPDDGPATDGFVDVEWRSETDGDSSLSYKRVTVPGSASPRSLFEMVVDEPCVLAFMVSRVGEERRFEPEPGFDISTWAELHQKLRSWNVPGTEKPMFYVQLVGYGGMPS